MMRSKAASTSLRKRSAAIRLRTEQKARPSSRSRWALGWRSAFRSANTETCAEAPADPIPGKELHRSGVNLRNAALDFDSPSRPDVRPVADIRLRRRTPATSARALGGSRSASLNTCRVRGRTSALYHPALRNQGIASERVEDAVVLERAP